MKPIRVKIDGMMYDVTDFLQSHPGGARILQESDGFDVTENFYSHHLSDVRIERYPTVRKIGPSQQCVTTHCGNGSCAKEPSQQCVTTHCGNGSCAKGPSQQCVTTHCGNGGESLFSGTQILTPEYKSLKRIVARKKKEFGNDLAWRVAWVGGVYVAMYAHWVHTMSFASSVALGFWMFPAVINLFHTQTHIDCVANWTKHIFNILGANTDIWKFQHNIQHHQYTKTNVDPDEYHGVPLLRVSREQPLHAYHAYQHLYAPLLYCFTTFGFMISNFICTVSPSLSRRFINPHIRTGSLSVVAYLLRCLVCVCLEFGVPLALGHRLSQVCVQFVLKHVLFGLQLGTFLSASHLSDVCMKEKSSDWLTHQIQSTVNFSSNSLIAHIYFAGLNLQIEHHLFPHIDHMNLLKIKDDVRAEIQKNGHTYNDLNVWDAVCAHFRILREMGMK